MAFGFKWKVTYRLIAKGSDYVHNLIGKYAPKDRRRLLAGFPVIFCVKAPAFAHLQQAKAGNEGIPE